jgi:protein O-mannosyl-transferase
MMTTGTIEAAPQNVEAEESLATGPDRHPAAATGLHLPLVIAAALLTYANSLFNAFSLDDMFIVEQNPRVQQLHDLGAIWLTPYWPTFGEHLGLYRPFAIFGYAVQWAIGGGAPWVFHAGNVLLHVGVSVLVYALLRRLTSAVPALIGAFLFAVHPLHTEVVAGVVGQAELLAAAAVLGACIVWVDRPDTGLSRTRLAIIIGLYLAGLLAKEGAVVLPGLLVALDVATRRVVLDRQSVRRYVSAVAWPVVVLALALAAYLTLRISVLGSIGGVDAAPNLPFLRQGHRFLSALRAWPEYARLLVYPMDLSADYSPGVILPVESLSPMVVLGATLMLGTVALALATPLLPAVGLTAAWFFIAVFPVSNLVLPIGVLLAERILYLPSVAVAIGIAFAWQHAQSRLQPRPLRNALLASAAIAVVFAGRAVLRNPTWKNTETVWDAIVREHPESYRAQWANGYRMSQRGNNELATGYFELAYRIWPDDAIVLNNLAGLYLQSGRYAEALPLLDRSERLTPGILNTTEQLYAFAYLGLNRFDESIRASIRADRLYATRVVILALRAQAYEGGRRFPEAVGTWRFATRHRRGRTAPTFWMMMARDLARSGLPDQALAATDTAAMLIEKGTPIDRSLQKLRTAIGSGCYADGASTDSAGTPPALPCADPLSTWGIVLPPAEKEVANPLQNATG